MKNIIVSDMNVSLDATIRWIGYGHYEITVDIGISKKELYQDIGRYAMRYHSTNSILFDARRDEDISYEEYQQMLLQEVEPKLTKDIEECVIIEINNGY